jgi:hypothetical protein
VEDRSNVQIDGLDAANSPFHLGEITPRFCSRNR